MSHPARLWLPEEAYTGPAAVAPLGTLVEDWAAQWLAAGKAALPYRWVRQERARTPRVDSETGFTLAPTSRGEATLAAALLGAQGDHASPHNAGDTALLRHVTQAARDDLAQRIAEWLAPAAAMAGPMEGPLYSLPILLNDETEIAALCVTKALLIAAARLRAAPPPARARVAPWREALDAQPLTLTPVIGRSRLTLAELEKLGPGDVIALDTPVHALLAIAVGPRTRIAGAVSIAPVQDHFEIRIERSPLEW